MIEKFLERVPFVPSTKKNADYKKKTVFLCLYFMLSYYIMCFLDLQFTYIYISQLISFHHNKTRHLPDLVSNSEPLTCKASALPTHPARVS